MNNLSSVFFNSDEIVSFLKQNTQLKEIVKKIFHQKIINQASQERCITVTSEEIQAEADCQRLEKRLEKATETMEWLADHMMTADDWEVGIRDRLIAKKLSECLFAKEAEKFFSQNRLDFEQILLYQIIVPYEKLAQEIFYQVEENEISFYEAAHLYDIDQRRRYQCGYEGKFYRWSLKPDVAAAIFSAELGELIGPFKTEQGYHLFKIEESIPAELTPEIAQDIINKMFREWLASELNYMLHSETDRKQYA